MPHPDHPLRNRRPDHHNDQDCGDHCAPAEHGLVGLERWIVELASELGYSSHTFLQQIQLSTADP
jgi:hypothetical protein